MAVDREESGALMNATEVIRELAEHSLLSDREFDGVGFIDRLLLLASEFGHVRATLAAEGTLRFEASGHAPCDVPLERAKSKLRMLCARLAVLCKESGGEFILYGGEGLIRAVWPSTRTAPSVPSARRWRSGACSATAPPPPARSST